MIRLYAALAIAFVTAGTLWFAYDAGRDSRDAYWLAKVEKQRQADALATQQIIRANENAAGESEARAAQLESELRTYEAELAKRTVGACAINSGDVDRLRQLLR